MSTNVEFPIGFSSGSSKQHSGLNEQPAQPLTGEERRGGSPETRLHAEMQRTVNKTPQTTSNL